jgi:hypothetical protein
VRLLKNFNFVINESAHDKLEKIKKKKNIGNNADAVEFLIAEVYRTLFGGA